MGTGTRSQLWIEAGDPPVWHRVVRRVDAGRYRAVCGWALGLTDGRIWPAKPGETGPEHDARCHDCAAGVETPPSDPEG